MGFRASHPIMHRAVASLLASLAASTVWCFAMFIYPKLPQSWETMAASPRPFAYYWALGFVIFGLPFWAAIFLAMTLIRGVMGSVALARADAIRRAGPPEG